ncbi:MAG TPA: hypothetical protein VFM88_07695 [Vicinamibacteria bacterium]|nr:hypothetical protein [Vicinamibacteria bacterium]
MISVEHELLRLVAAVGERGAAGMRETLAEILGATAPFDSGEIAFLRNGEVVRWALGATQGPVAGDDLVRHVVNHPVSLRIDHLLEAEPFPATHERLEAAGLRSLLVLPITAREGFEGAIVLAREYGWAFAGASLRRLEPVAAMVGLLLAVAQKLTNGTARKRRADRKPRATGQPQDQPSLSDGDAPH